MKILSRLTYITKLSMVFTSLLLVSACAAPLATTHITGDGYDVLTTTAANSSVIIRDKDSLKVICAEPTPDVAVNAENDLAFSFAIPSANDDSSESNSVSEVGLGGRSVNLLITRETFYRTCEFISNTSLSQEQKIEIFKEALKAVITINQHDLGTGTADNATMKAPASSPTVPPVTPITGSK